MVSEAKAVAPRVFQARCIKTNAILVFQVPQQHRHSALHLVPIAQHHLMEENQTFPPSVGSPHFHHHHHRRAAVLDRRSVEQLRVFQWAGQPEQYPDPALGGTCSVWTNPCQTPTLIKAEVIDLRDPWWIFTTLRLLHVLKTSYSFTFFGLIRTSPRFAVMLFCMFLSLIFLIMDVIVTVTHIARNSGINPYWRVSVLRAPTVPILINA